MGFYKNFLNLCAKPEGLLGRYLLRKMNVHHAEMADWGISRLQIEEPKEILDIGCGGGRHLYELLKRYRRARGTAIDYSPLCVRKTAKFNREFVRAGRCTAEQGDVSSLTFPVETFDLATAFETVYFWPGLVPCLTQTARVLKPGGTLLIVNETDGLEPVGRRFEKIIDLMTVYTAEELKEALHAAGFSEVAVSHHEAFPWIAVAARK